DWTDEEFAAVLAGELDSNDIPRMHYEKEHGVKVVFEEPGIEAEGTDEEPVVETETEPEIAVESEPEITEEAEQEQTKSVEETKSEDASEVIAEPETMDEPEPVDESEESIEVSETTPEQAAEAPETDSNEETGALE
ncbi:MAG: hypothetical protein MRZ47_00380, partial [Lachnospiraceae bacterium]|nr:hypothetical protein [Lachnospiraceae bacterium]